MKITLMTSGIILGLLSWGQPILAHSGTLAEIGHVHHSELPHLISSVLTMVGMIVGISLTFKLGQALSAWVKNHRS